MSLEDKILYAFVTGEVSETFWGRTDLSKYDLGAALASNYFIDYKGGMLSRQGSEMGGLLPEGVGKLARFQGTITDFLLVFSDFKLRFMQDNSYVFEASKTISAVTLANPAVFTSNGHGYANGDLIQLTAASGMVELNARQGTIVNKTTNTFQVKLGSGQVLDATNYTAADGTESVARAYTVALPYAEADLYKLDVQQRYNNIRLTHAGYARRVLTFISETNWELSLVVAGSSISPPRDITGSPSGAGSAGTSFAVTSVDADGIESVISDYHLALSITNYTVTSGSYTVTWKAVPNAVSYNIYRGYVLKDGTNVTRGMNVGYIGSAVGTQFTDNNILPDYSKTPPINYDPFSADVVTSITVLSAGSGFPRESEMVLTGPGEFFSGYAVINNDGSVSGIKILDGGDNYTDPRVHIVRPPIERATFKSTINGSGAITALTIITGGDGYVTGDLLYATGGNDFQATITAAAGAITSLVINNTGSDYVAPTFYLRELGTPASPPATLATFTHTLDAEGGITDVQVSTGGAGYSIGDKLFAGDTGNGFVGALVIVGGAVTEVVVERTGRGYVTPNFFTADEIDGGAVFDVFVTGIAEATHPALFRIFQQRGVYLATDQEPASLWASKPGQLNNYDYSQIITPSDGYSFTFDSLAVKPIKHALVVRNGMLVFTDYGITQLRAETGKAVSGLNALAEPQVYTGVGNTPPLAINLDVLFLETDSASLNALFYTEYTESFQMQDLSVLAGHLLGEGNEVLKMVYSPSPYKLIYMVREDGKMLTLTYSREQDVYGWAQYSTYGLYKDVEEIEENGGKYVYQLVSRYLQGAWQTFVERIPRRIDDYAENYWGVDCGLQLPMTKPDAILSGDGVTGTITLTADSAVFTSGNVGDMVYYAGGKLEVDAFISSTQLTATYRRDADQTIAFGPSLLPRPATSGDWSIDTPVTEVNNLWHLEGEFVSVCYDGDAVLDQQVVDGKLTVQLPSTKVYVGLPYACRGTSLPMIVPNRIVEGQDSKLFSVVPRLYHTRGMSFGDSFDELEEIEDRTDEDWGESLALRSDVTAIPINATYEADAQLFWEQKYPLPAALLGFVARLDIGDK